MRKLGISEVSEFSILAFILKPKTRTTQKFFQDVNFKESVLFDDVGNFRGFRVFDFGPYDEIENSKNLEILC